MKFLPIALVVSTLFAGPAVRLAEGPEVQAALDHISADSLRGNLSFLASDALEGRDTPSRGLDIAAEFIASRFRLAGLQPITGDSYFQNAAFEQLTRRTDGLTLVVATKSETLSFEPPDVAVTRTDSALDIKSLPVYRLSGDSIPAELDNALAGKAVLVRTRGSALFRQLREKKVAVVLAIASGSRNRTPSSRELVAADRTGAPSVPIVSLRGDAAGRLFESLPDGLTAATVSLHAPGPERKQVQLRNVIGVLRGSDPQLQSTYVMVTAHYDHLGTKPEDSEGDRIFNGANDDGSGVVSVIELAQALASMRPHPRRSIIFMTVFGEEKGLLGSEYYGRHPVFPLERTIADINIEQVGRTDDNDGPEIASATLTGYTYSDVPGIFEQAGKRTGVKVHDRNTGSDPYFERSDNLALANAGIPSHTLAVSLDYPDYHSVGDKWYKVDYTNMTSIDRMLGLGIISLANDPESPKWNPSNPNTKKYTAAWKKLHAVPSN